MVTLPRSRLAEILAHAREHRDQEVCGVLGGRENCVDRVIRARNTAETPRTRFEMDSRDIFSALRSIENDDMDLIGFYHSHTHTQAYPSPTDVAMWSNTWGPEALCFICSLMEEDRPALRAFRIDHEGRVTEEKVTVED